MGAVRDEFMTGQACRAKFVRIKQNGAGKMPAPFRLKTYEDAARYEKPLGPRLQSYFMATGYIAAGLSRR